MWIVLISVTIILFLSYLILRGMQSTIKVENIYEGECIERVHYNENKGEYRFIIIDGNSRRQIVVKEKYIEVIENCENAKVIVFEMENENYNKAIIYVKK